MLLFVSRTTLKKDTHMRWIEILQIKSYSEQDRDNALKLLREIAVIGADIPKKIELLTCQNLPTDIGVCLYWDKESRDSIKSDLAEKLNAALKYFGWISHTIWDPVKEELSCQPKK